MEQLELFNDLQPISEWLPTWGEKWRMAVLRDAGTRSRGREETKADKAACQRFPIERSFK